MPLSPEQPPPRSLQEFVRTEAAGGVALLLATAVALVWANSGWGDGYARAWHTAVRLQVGAVGFDGDLRHLVNEGLMALTPSAPSGGWWCPPSSTWR